MKELWERGGFRLFRRLTGHGRWRGSGARGAGNEGGGLSASVAYTVVHKVGINLSKLECRNGPDSLTEGRYGQPLPRP